MLSYENQITNAESAVTTPEELRDFLNNGAIHNLASLLEFVTGNDGRGYSFEENGGEFTSYWLEKINKRILVVQSTVTRLPGLFLNLPVKPDDYELAAGEINAHFIPIPKEKVDPRVPEPYTQGSGIVKSVGKPITVVKVLQVAEQELSSAAGIVFPEDI